MSKVLTFLSGLAVGLFYGEVRIRFKNGEVVKVTVEQDYLVENLPGDSVQ
jgi:hypothetical protein